MPYSRRSAYNPTRLPRAAGRHARPGALTLICHIPSSLRLQWALLRDPRISEVRKLLYLTILAMLLLFLLLPDALGEALSALVLPIIGLFTGVPLDAAFDWVALMLLAVNLLRLFPTPIVVEHYQRLFRHRRRHA
jgi:hypothetical protein